ncbi:MAG: hypothetical protein LBK53_05570 [Heliobacteriaceae bacterium]|jgi:hypothetical protein|nr:hypothetical protein [Heliobacteriaceae bacterium]
MGLSASQAKLLSLTSRISDNELRAQFITNSKVRLAEDSNEAAAEYMRALDSTNLQYASYDAQSNKAYQKLTAGAIMEYGDLKNQYGLINQYGQIYVSSEDIANYNKVDNLPDFLKLYGVETVENSKYAPAIEDVYGKNWKKFYSQTNPFGTYNNINTSTSDKLTSLANTIGATFTTDPETGIKTWSLDNGPTANPASAYSNAIKAYKTAMFGDGSADSDGGEVGKLNTALQNAYGNENISGTIAYKIKNSQALTAEDLNAYNTAVRNAYQTYNKNVYGINSYTLTSAQQTAIQNGNVGGIYGTYLAARNTYTNTIGTLENNLDTFTTTMNTWYANTDDPAMLGVMDNWVEQLHKTPADVDIPLYPVMTPAGLIVSANTQMDLNNYLNQYAAAGTASVTDLAGTPPSSVNVSAAAKERCYDDVSATNGVGFYHMEHNLSVLMFGSDALLQGSNTFDYNDGTNVVRITVNNNNTGLYQNDGGTQYPQTDKIVELLLYNAANHTNQTEKNKILQAIQDIKNVYARMAMYHSGSVNSGGATGSYSSSVITGSNPLDTTSGSDDTALYNAWKTWWETTVPSLNLMPVGYFEDIEEYVKYETGANGRNKEVKDWVTANIDPVITANNRLESQFELDNAAFTAEAQQIDDAWNARLNSYIKYLNTCERLRYETYESIDRIPHSEVPNQNDQKCEWYTNLWYRMGSLSETKRAPNSNKYIQLDEKYMNNEAWLKYMLEIGNISLEQVIFNETGSAEYPSLAQREWKSIMYKNSSDISEQEDKIAITKAEIKYEKALREIQSKDKQYDSDLKKLDTQHNALQTEYESLKSVIDKNVERSFKAFS